MLCLWLLVAAPILAGSLADRTRYRELHDGHVIAPASQQYKALLVYRIHGHAPFLQHQTLIEINTAKGTSTAWADAARMTLHYPSAAGTTAQTRLDSSGFLQWMKQQGIDATRADVQGEALDLAAAVCDAPTPEKFRERQMVYFAVTGARGRSSSGSVIPPFIVVYILLATAGVGAAKRVARRVRQRAGDNPSS